MCNAENLLLEGTSLVCKCDPANKLLYIYIYIYIYIYKVHAEQTECMFV
jgi:hypothetical protein